MKYGQRRARTFVGGFLLFLAACWLMPSAVQAYTLDVRNPYNDKMSVAIVDFDDQAGKWRCQGWFGVTPQSTRRISMPTSTQRTAIYLYARTTDKTWSGDGIASSVVRVVNSNSFFYYDGQPCPAGPHPREVFFVKYELANGFLYWSPE